MADAALALLVAPVEILDADVAVLDDALSMSPEKRPDLLRRRVDLERERVVLHRQDLPTGRPPVSSGGRATGGAPRRRSRRSLGSLATDAWRWTRVLVLDERETQLSHELLAGERLGDGLALA